MNELLEKWKKKLNLTNWYIYLIPAKKEEIKAFYITRRAGIRSIKVNADNHFNTTKKVSFIRYAKLSERSLIHELLHIVYPLESENKIENRTIQIIKSLKNKI